MRLTDVFFLGGISAGLIALSFLNMIGMPKEKNLAFLIIGVLLFLVLVFIPKGKQKKEAEDES